MAPRFRRPSPAFVLALIALFVALEGSAIAIAIVPRAKFADKAGVAANALKLSGKTAAQIVASVPKPPEPPPPTPPLTSVASFTTVKSAPFTINPQSEQNVTATCDAGQKAIGGGFSNPSNALVIEAGSSPTADGTGWVEDLINLSTSTTGTGAAIVTCIK